VSQLKIGWAEPGPVSAQFMQADAAVSCLNGPIGSGKTTTNFVKHLANAMRQRPSTRDGVRKYRVAVIRNTYRQLWRSTLPSWWKRVPQNTGTWTGSKDGPATHRIKFVLNDGSKVDFEAMFAAIGDHDVEEFMRGFETTGFYLNELDTLAEEVLTYARGRAGRYPDMEDGGPSWYGVTADCNAPEFDSWLHNKIVNEWTEGIDFFRQPPAMLRDQAGVLTSAGAVVVNPESENLANLPEGYYWNQVKDQPAHYVQRMILNEFGYNRDGKAVFPEFNDQFHVAKRELEPVETLPLLIGADAGLSPAAIIRQRLPNGQWRALDELCCEHGTGPKRFSRQLNQLLAERYGGWRPEGIKGWADPSAAYGADTTEGEAAWIDTVASETGIRFRPAPGANKLIPRLEAVRQTLTRLIDGEVPGNLLSPRCRTLRKAYAAGYRYRRIKSIEGHSVVYTTEPVKDEYSHVADADQYVTLACGEYDAVLGRKSAAAAARGQSHAVSDLKPRGGWRDDRRQTRAIRGG